MWAKPMRFNNDRSCRNAGTVRCCRLTLGRQHGLTQAVAGTKRRVVFNQEGQSELQGYGAAKASNRQGFCTSLVGHEHPGYATFFCVSGYGLGLNDQNNY